jgi:hypothetical protein
MKKVTRFGLCFILLFPAIQLFSQQFDYVVHIDVLDIKDPDQSENVDPYVEVDMGLGVSSQRTPSQSDVPDNTSANEVVCNYLVFKNVLTTMGAPRLRVEVWDEDLFFDDVMLVTPNNPLAVFPHTQTNENDECKVTVTVTRHTSCTSEEAISEGRISENRRYSHNPYSQPGDNITTDLHIDVDETQPSTFIDVYEQIPKGFTYIDSDPPGELMTIVDDEGLEINALLWTFTEDEFSDKDLSYSILASDSTGSFYYNGYIQTFTAPAKLNFTGDEKVVVSEMIPTLSEWGVIVLLLLVVAIGMVFLYQRKTALAFAGVSESSTAKPKLFDRKLFAKVFAVVLLIGAAGLVAAYLYFGSITSADPFGVVVSSGIVAYMVHLWLLKKS